MNYTITNTVGSGLLVLLLFALSISSEAVINGSSVTVSGTTTCNNGVIEREVAGTMTTTCGTGWSVGALPEGPEILFEEDFDDQDLWNPTLNASFPATAEFFAADGAVIPTGWDAFRSTQGHSGNPESLYVSGDSEKVRGGTGKAFVAYRQIRSSSAFWTDSILAKTFENKTSLYVRFYIKYQTSWTRQGITKVFRIQSWNGRDQSDFWSSVNIQPAMIWDFEHNSFGTRNTVALRNTPDITVWPEDFKSTLPRAMVNGDLPMDYINDAPSPPSFPDLVNGGLVDSPADHYELFGDAWHKVEFYVQMNSAPGERDGVLMQWMDDQLLFSNNQVPWMMDGASPGRTWDVVKFGGNDSWNTLDDGTPATTETLSEWYAIDDIVICETRESCP